ncbi:dnaJ homolog subfamily C member 8-like [Teleopsis dalmanni]|uniref:dnaJ homolog subfamily C member 8-like n=1 Tax=Teleopsis dalmanni TaxID=139649 RepID=UPI000D32C61A|nr:dnaJ homolog subfamily C member 8-like [Teleopsis dalmanni]
MSNNSDDMSTSKKSFNTFYIEVKEIEKRDSALTSTQQIDHLLRPGSTYFNLNPFEVLQVQAEATIDVIKKRYHTMTKLVHPDRNPDNKDRARMAFDIVNRSWRTLENEVTRKKCLDIYEEAKERTNHMIAKKRKKQKKEHKRFEDIPEDDPENYKHALHVMVMKLFADVERKQQQLEQRDQEDRKRKREAEIEEEDIQEYETEWQKNYEESRQSRVDSWHDFQSKHMGRKLLPPKHKPETR